MPAIFFLLSILCATAASAGEVRPDVQLLLVDTLRADHLSVYGYDRQTSPSLDRFASSGAVFEDVFATASWTLPSVGSVLTGAYPSVHGLRAEHEGPEKVRTLRPGIVTLAEAFRKAGYRTIAVVTSEWVAADHGLRNGFEDFRLLPQKGSRNLPEQAEKVHEVAAALLEKDRSRPTFLYLHYLDVHGPYLDRTRPDEITKWWERRIRKLSWQAQDLLPGARGGERILTDAEIDALDYLRLPGAKTLNQYVDAYDAGIYDWDRAFGEWIDLLRTKSRLDNSIIAITSDHGEEFLEHGGWEHGETLYQEQLAVPWVIRGPGVKAARIDRQVVSLIDVAPTLLELADVPVPDTMQGRNVLSGGDPNRVLFAEVDACEAEWDTCENRAVRSGNRKLISTRNGRQVFDLRSDPGEHAPRALGSDDELARELDSWTRANKQIAAQMGKQNEAVVSDDVRERLRALGY